MNKKILLVLTLLLVSLVLTGTTATGLTAPEYTVMTANTPELGTFLVDSQGKTLYYFTKDEPGVSTTAGQVAANWPAFYVAEIVVPPSLDPADCGVITRSDGQMQTTFRGWPLYYFIKDMAAGDVKGQKVMNVWFVVNIDQ